MRNKLSIHIVINIITAVNVYCLLDDWHSHLISFDFNFGSNTQFKGSLLSWVILVILYKSTTLRKYINPDTE